MFLPAQRGAVLLAVLLSAIPGVARAQGGATSPWDFESSAEKRDAEKQFSRYWYENYPQAVALLDASSPGPAELAEAVSRLKVSIATQRDSDPALRHPVERRNIAYFPYYRLAVAYRMLGRADLAKRCLDRESELGAIGPSEFAADFKRLQTQVDAVASASELLELATRIEGWASGAGGIRLSAAGRGRIGELQSLKKNLESELRSPAAGTMGFAGNIAIHMIGIIEEELAPLRARMQKLAGAPWREAFSTPPDPAGCAMPGGENDAKRVKAGVDAIERCHARAVAAMRAAGDWACRELSRERKTLEALAPDREALLGAPPTIADLPAGCALAWQTAALGELGPALDGIPFDTLRSEYRTGVQTVRAELGQKRDALQSAALAALARKPSIPRGCVADLNLSGVARKIGALPADAAAVTDPAALDGRIDDLLTELMAGLESGVGLLGQDRDQCTGLDTTNLDALDAALAAYKQDRGNSRLQALCATAAKANSDINTCWAGNTALVRENVEDAAWLLDAAVEMRGSIRTSPDADLSCLTDVRGKLRPAAPSRDISTWSQTQRDLVNQAQACLATHRDAWKTTFDATHARVASVREGLKPLASAAEDGGPLERLKPVAQAAERLGATFAALAGLYDSEPSGVAALRQTLAAQDIAEQVPSDWWSRAETLSEKPERLRAALRAIRDRAVGATVVGADDELAPLEQRASSVTPFLALERAFDAFGRGAVDEAILELRSARSAGRLPASGRPAALGHAALAYFLFTKASAASVFGSDGAAAELLRNDALAEARAATTAEAGFEPPVALFASTSFRTFFSQHSR